MTEEQWTTTQQEIIDAAAEANPDAEVPDPPEHPPISNPGMFTIQNNWTDRQISREKAIHVQKLELFSHRNKLIQACLQDMEKTMPTELIADLCGEDDELMLSVTPASLIKHMKNCCDVLKPTDISTVMETLNKPFNESMK